MRKGKLYPSKPPPQSLKTWEEVRREKEERILKAKREWALSTPLETTSTDAIDTEEAQEISRVPDVEPITEKELDQRLREALIELQQVKPVGDNTIPPHYSREMSRYEPPIPVKKRRSKRP